MTCRKEEGGPWAPQRTVDPMINVVSLLLLWDGEELGILGSYWAYIYIGPIGYNAPHICCLQTAEMGGFQRVS